MDAAEPSDAAFSLLHAAGWSVGDTAHTDPITGRLVWLVYCQRGEQQVIAKADAPVAAWSEAARLANEAHRALNGTRER